MITFFKKVLGMNELSPLELKITNLPFHYNNQIYSRCNGTICDINGQEGLFFIYLNDRIPSKRRYEIGVLLGDMTLVKDSKEISTTYNSQLMLWELSMV